MKAVGYLRARVKGAVLAVAASIIWLLVNPNEAAAKSKLVDMTMEPMWSSETIPGEVVSFKITVKRQGQGFLKVVFSSGGMPEGVNVTFTPSYVRFTGRVPETQTAIMTITCPSPLPVASWPFTVTGTSRRESITITNWVAFTLPISPVLYIDPPVNGQTIIRGEDAIPWQVYEIQSTTDVANPVWTPFGSTTADGDGRFVFTVQITEPMRFFRAVALE